MEPYSLVDGCVLSPTTPSPAPQRGPLGPCVRRAPRRGPGTGGGSADTGLPNALAPAAEGATPESPGPRGEPPSVLRPPVLGEGGQWDWASWGFRTRCTDPSANPAAGTYLLGLRSAVRSPFRAQARFPWDLFSPLSWYSDLFSP